MPNKTITFGTDLLPLRDKADNEGGFNLGITGQAWNIYGNLTGNASTSTSWVNSQTVYVDLTSSGNNSTLNGGQSSAQVLKVNGTLGIANGGTGANSVAINTFFAGPSSDSAGAPEWRTITADDLPSLSDTYLSTTGGTLTGDLIQTTGYIHGQAPSTSYPHPHSIKLGHQSDDKMNFYEYGGVFNWYKSNGTTDTLLMNLNGNTLTVTNLAGNASSATKIAAALASTTKLYLLGTSTTLTNTAANVDLKGDTGVYLTTDESTLSAKTYSWNVSGTEKAHTVYNTTDDTIDFVFD